MLDMGLSREQQFIDVTFPAARSHQRLDMLAR